MTAIKRDLLERGWRSCKYEKDQIQQLFSKCNKGFVTKHGFPENLLATDQGLFKKDSP